MNHKEIPTSTACHAFHGFILIRRHLIRIIKARRLCRRQYSDFQEVISFNGEQLRGSGRHHVYITAGFIKHLCEMEIKHLRILIKRTYKSRKLVCFLKREIQKHVQSALGEQWEKLSYSSNSPNFDTMVNNSSFWSSWSAADSQTSSVSDALSRAQPHTMNPPEQ